MSRKIKLEKRLGQGGVSRIYHGKDQDNHEFAVKILQPKADDYDRDQFIQEAEILEELSGHPNIVNYYGKGTFTSKEGSRLDYILLEYVPDGTFEDALQNLSVPREEAVVKIMIETLNGLEHVHKKGIVHRDIKPGNILMKGLTPKICDFGLAYRIGTETRIGPIDDTSVGTVCFIPPEQLECNEPLPCSDVYALGATIFNVLYYDQDTCSYATNMYPYNGLNSAAITQNIMDNKRTALKLNPDTPKAEILETIIEFAIQYNPVRRIQTASEFKSKLQLWLKIIHENQNKISTAKKQQPQTYSPSYFWIAAEIAGVTAALATAAALYVSR